MFSQSGRKPVTPTQLTKRILDDFKQNFSDLVVEGEISGLTRASSGHVYLQLKDESSNVKAVIWRSSVPGSGLGSVKDGLKALAYGYLSVYGPRSEYQLIVSKIRPHGAGSLSQAYELLKKKLFDEGLFKAERKRALPYPPRRVALLASNGSAAVRDFLQTAVRRHRGAWISLYPVQVQGRGAAEEMARALEDVNSWGDFDLVVITRGGGSMEDLWAFNEELLVRAVANSRVPVLAAIGHSTDSPLVEMAADAKAITPTDAANVVFPRDEERLRLLSFQMDELARRTRDRLKDKGRQLSESVQQLGQFTYHLKSCAQTIDNCLFRLRSSVLAYIGDCRNKLNQLSRDLERLSPARDLAWKEERLLKLLTALNKAGDQFLETRKRRLQIGLNALELLSPLSILNRGYAVVSNESGGVVRSVAELSPGQLISIRLPDGKMPAAICSSKKR
ncbi:MAG: exodeoxyribonuclease VII large subunit [Deltaproteobacteria bacterium]|nr:exodeoxyribonuclease VII large subunit [Deltaproteobacteria bacterium]